MIVLGLDPGPTESHLTVIGSDGGIREHGAWENHDLMGYFAIRGAELVPSADAVLVIEKVESFGMAVGASVFETVFWSGRFAQAWYPRRCERLGRKDVKLHLCHTMRATDSNIRQALLDRFGGEKAIGKKATPGPLYGLKGHEFAALAVALTWRDQNADRPAPLRPGIRPEF